MRFIERVQDGYKRGYKVGKYLDELITLYGRENFIKGNVRDRDKEKLEYVSHGLRIMYGPYYSMTSLCMAYGFVKYKLKHRKGCYNSYKSSITNNNL
jgi:hypothetical protein